MDRPSSTPVTREPGPISTSSDSMAAGISLTWAGSTPKHQRLVSVSEVVPRAARRARLCADEEYVSVLNARAFDFPTLSSSSPSPASLSSVEPVPDSRRVGPVRRLVDPTRGGSNPSSYRSLSVQAQGPPPREDRHVERDLPYPPSSSSDEPTRSFTQHPAGPFKLSLAPALDRDTSSASVTPVSPKTPPFIGLTSIPERNPKHPAQSPYMPPSTTGSLTAVLDALQRHGFPYVEEVKSLICLRCSKPRILYRGILRSHVRKHVAEAGFQALASELEHLVSQLPAFAKTIEEVPRRPCGRSALPYLPVLQGFRCLLCDFCAVSSRYVDNHWGEKHKGAARPAILYAPASLQTLGGSRQLTRLFWVVS